MFDPRRNSCLLSSSLELEGLLYRKVAEISYDQDHPRSLAQCHRRSRTASPFPHSGNDDPMSVAYYSVSSSSVASFASTWAVPFQSSGSTLSRPDIQQRRRRRLENVQKKAQASWHKRALWKARRLGFNTKQAEELMGLFQNYCGISSDSTERRPRSMTTSAVIEIASSGADSKNRDDYSDERTFPMHSGELELALFLGKRVGVSTAEAIAQGEDERITNARLSLADLTRALGDLFFPALKAKRGENLENPEDVTGGSSKAKLVNIAKWLLGRHSSSGFLDCTQWMTLIKSRDIEYAEAAVQQNPVVAFTQNDRRRGTFRPTKGHSRPYSARISPRKPAFANVPKIVRARKKKAEIMSEHDLRRIRNYVLHRGRLLGLSDQVRLEAANEAVERAKGGSSGFADYGAASRRLANNRVGSPAFSKEAPEGEQGGSRSSSPNRRHRKLKTMNGQYRNTRCLGKVDGSDDSEAAGDDVHMEQR